MYRILLKLREFVIKRTVVSDNYL